MSGLSFVNTPLQKLLNKRNIFSRVDALEAKDEAPSLTAESLSEITPDAGDIYVTEITNIINNEVVGAPGGIANSLQYNDGAGAFGGSADLTWDDTLKQLKIGGGDDNPNIQGIGDGVSYGLSLHGGDSASAVINAGKITVKGGGGYGAGNGGSVSIVGGEGGATGNGNTSSFVGGQGGDTSGDGGPAIIEGGNAPTDGDGADVKLTPGTGAGGGHVDGSVLIGDGGSTNYIKITRAGVMSFVGNAKILLPTKTPATSGAAGTAGEICWDSSYIYICVATDTWKRAGIATW